LARTESLQPVSTVNAAGSQRGNTGLSADARPATSKPAPSFLRPETTEKSFAAQLGRGFAAALRQGGGVVTLRIQPEGLGDLKIRLNLQQSTLAARFEVQTRQARELLDTNLPELRSALEARGLNVDRLEVQVVRPQAQEAPAEQGGRQPAADQDSSGAATWGGGGDHRQPAEDPRDNAADGPGADRMPPEPFPRSAEPGGYAWLEPEVVSSEGGARTLRLRLDAVA
jgi:flagellar hook-length control protein FliK